MDHAADPSRYAPGIARTGRRSLPLSLGLGAMLLDQAGYRRPRVLQAVSSDEPAEACVRLGAELAGSGRRTALLVMGDGSARRTLKAPGYLDPRAAAFDATIESAVRDGELIRLRWLDEKLARELMVTGRPAWQGAVRRAQQPAAHHGGPVLRRPYSGPLRA
jgi:hypothetical protein